MDKPEEKPDKRNRKLRRAARRERSTCRGCRKNRRDLTDTGTVEAGHHTHGRRPKAHDHATGYGFVQDKSTTKAVLNRMTELGVLGEEA